MTDPDDDQTAADLARAAREANVELARLTTNLTRGLGPALSRLVFDGARASDVFASLGRSIARSALNSAIRPVQSGLSSALGAATSGLVGSATRMLGFAKGGVVSGATPFTAGGALGVMGEAGPEAILPLARGPDGRLGVRAGPAAARSRGAPAIHIHARDADSLRRSSAQIAAQLSRALDRGQRLR